MDFDACFTAVRQLQLAAAALSLNVIGGLGNDPTTAEALAERLELPDVDRLRRLLRGLVWADLARVEAEGEAPMYALTDTGERLLDERPPSPADDVQYETTFFYHAWAHLADWVRDGSIPFDRAHGESIWDRLARDPAAANAYARPLSARTREYAHALAEHPAVTGAKTLIDVGGGEGMLAVELLRHLPSANAVVYDRPAMQPGAERLARDAGVTDRCRFEPGDFFERVPPGGEVYLIKWILHDFNDEECVTILRRCGEAMGEHATLLVIERPVPEGEQAAADWAQPDLNMLVLSGGRERTQAEYAQLLDKAGLTLRHVSPLEAVYGFAALEAVRQ